jgi:hypothetical protein
VTGTTIHGGPPFQQAMSKGWGTGAKEKYNRRSFDSASLLSGRLAIDLDQPEEAVGAQAGAGEDHLQIVGAESLGDSFA